jgi:hypothetical protein
MSKKWRENFASICRTFYLSAATLGHIPFTKWRLLLTQPVSLNRFSIFAMCLSSYHILTYTRPQRYPASLPNPNITSLTSSFNSSMLLASHTSHTSSQISLMRHHSSPFSFFKHPHPLVNILSIHCTALSYSLLSTCTSISFHNSVKSKSRQKTLFIGNREMSDKLRNRLQKKKAYPTHPLVVSSCGRLLFV